MEPNFNLCTNPFSEFDDDEDEQGMEKGDRFFGSRSRSKPLTKAELDQENFVILNDEYGEYLDPESILSIFNSCGRDMDQTIDTIEEVITSSPSVISSENSGGGSLGEDAMRGGGGALSESEPCQFWLDNGWCVRRCTQIHNPEGIPCIYYNDKYKFCPAGSKCMFLHTTIEEQNARIDRNADNSLWYLNDDDVYNYDVLDKSFADFLKQIKANHGRVFGPLIDTVFDYM